MGLFYIPPIETETNGNIELVDYFAPNKELFLLGPC